VFSGERTLPVDWNKPYISSKLEKLDITVKSNPRPGSSLKPGGAIEGLILSVSPPLDEVNTIQYRVICGTDKVGLYKTPFDGKSTSKINILVEGACADAKILVVEFIVADKKMSFEWIISNKME
jgi:hypothetical protein